MRQGGAGGRYGLPSTFGIVAALTAALLAACASGNVNPSSTPTAPPSQSVQPTQTPVTETPLPSPTWTLVPESSSWTGAARGTLTKAMTTCHLPDWPVDTIDLRTPAYSGFVDFPQVDFSPRPRARDRTSVVRGTLV